MADTDSFDDRWGGLPVEAPRFNYTPHSSLIESEPHPIEPYKLTPVEGDPFERAAERLRAPYKHVNDPNVGMFEKDDRFPYRSNIPVMASPFVHIAEGMPAAYFRGLTSFKDIAEGNLQVTDPMTGMLTHEGAMRGIDAASVGGAGGLVGSAEKGAVLRSGIARQEGERAAQELAAQPFYSAVEHAVNNGPKQALPNEWLGPRTERNYINKDKVTGKETPVKEVKYSGLIGNMKGVKAEELEWMGLPEWLQEKANRPGANRVEPVTKQEIQDFVNAHKTELKEKTSGESHPDAAKIIELDNQARALERAGDIESAQKIRDEIKAFPKNESFRSRYSQYQLPGGENYREKLLTLPNKNNAKIDEIEQRMNKIRDTGDFANFEEYQALRNERDALTNQNYNNQYSSSHWDEPNVLAHVRMNDRLVEGKKSLHLEEIQSDWHQAGRDKGYKGTDKNLSPVDQGAIDAFGVPDAPFKKTWHELALKRMVREAAEKGYDRLSWTPGEAQAARYDLSKQVSKISVYRETTGKYTLDGVTNTGNPISIGELIEPQKLSEVVGKELADKIINQKEQHKSYSGVDLKVGGEGMKGFYDKMIPLALEKIGKEHGVKVKTTNINVDSTAYRSLAHFIDWAAEHRPALNRNQLAEKWSKGKDDLLVKQYMESQKPEPVHYIDIPQSLKDQALGKGFPLFNGGHMFTPVQGNPHDQNNK